VTTKKKTGPPPRPQKTLSLLLDPGILRAFALGAVAVAACVYALARAYTRATPTRDSAHGAAPALAPTELPAPELLPLDITDTD
jgi:hypothetical protein